VQDLPNRHPYINLPSKFQQCSGTGGSNVFAGPGHDLVERGGRIWRNSMDASFSGTKKESRRKKCLSDFVKCNRVVRAGDVRLNVFSRRLAQMNADRKKGNLKIEKEI